MNTRLRTPFVLLAALAAGAAQAHFMWASLSPNPRNPSVRFEFAEAPGESVIPRFSDRGPAVKGVGPFTLKAQDDVLVGGLEAPVKVAGASLDYGILDRKEMNRGVFMLYYYAKAAADPASSQTSIGLPLEMSATDAGGTLTVRVTQGGAPAAGAEVVATLPGEAKPFTGKTDAEGRLALPRLVGLGAVAVRAGVAEEAKGEFEGKPFTMVRRYTTLTLANSGAAAAKADPEAYAMLEKAANTRSNMPADLAGIKGTLVVKTPEGKTLRSPFDYTMGSPLDIDADGWPRVETVAAAELVTSLFEHRRATEFARADGRNPLTFGEENGPNGRRILLHDRMNSSYLVRGDEITEVDRVMGGTRLVLTILENARTADGKTLPRRFDGKLYDLKGSLLKTYSYYDEYVLVDGAWLPKLRRVTTLEKGKTTTRETRFEGLSLTRREE